MNQEERIEGTYAIAKAMGMTEDFLRIGQLLLIAEAPKMKKYIDKEVYSLTKAQVEILKRHVRQMREELRK